MATMISPTIRDEPSTSADLSRVYRMLLTRLREATPDQSHVLAFWSELDDIARWRLAAQLDEIDFGLFDEACSTQRRLGSDFSPPTVINLEHQLDSSHATTIGTDCLSSGRVAVAIVAGGSGTRLGFPHPKGMLPIGPVSGRTIFQVLIERIIAIGRRCGHRIPLYLMTSPITHDETIQFLSDNHWFGLHRDDLRFICQGTLPVIDAQSKRFLLAKPGELATAPDGHGGFLDAARKAGVFEELNHRGIDVLCFGQIDNPLQPLADPTCIGLHVSSTADVTTFVVRKLSADERVGTLVVQDGHTLLVEYSELPVKVANARLNDGALAFGAGNSGSYVFRVPFLQRLSTRPQPLPIHPCLKTVSHLNAHGDLVHPRQPSGIQFERFIFDTLRHTSQSLLVEIDRAAAFAPIKNSDSVGVDCPSSAKASFSRLHATWLRRAGVIVEPNMAVEISPFVSTDGLNLPSGLLPKRIEKATFISRLAGQPEASFRGWS